MNFLEYYRQKLAYFERMMKVITKYLSALIIPCFKEFLHHNAKTYYFIPAETTG